MSANQLAEIRKMHAERLKAQREEERKHGVQSEPKKGKVIGGKYFENPPQQLGMGEYEAIVNRYQRIQRQKQASVSKISIDGDSGMYFQSYLRMMDFKILRYGIMYGTVEDGAVQVDAIYEPDQEYDGEKKRIVVKNDPRLDKVDAIASLLGFQRVGIITSAPPMFECDPILSGQEVLMCAEQQAKYGNHCCLVQMRPDERGELKVEAYQVSEQCVDIFKEGTLSEDPGHPGMIKSERQLEAVKEMGMGKSQYMACKEPTHEVDTIWFTVPVPIDQMEGRISNRFIRLNRPGQAPPTFENVAIFLKDPKRKNAPFVEQVADFHLLVFLSDVLDMKNDIPGMCRCIRNKDSKGMEGFEILIKSAVGLA